MHALRRRALALLLSIGVATSILVPVSAASATDEPVEPAPVATIEATPTTEPSTTAEPTTPPEPSAAPTAAPSTPPTAEPTTEPTPEPSPTATPEPSPEPTQEPEPEPVQQVDPLLWMTVDADGVRFGRTLTVSGRLYDEHGAGLADEPVRIVGLSAKTGWWELLATVTTRADGRFSHAFTPLSGYRLKAEVLESPTLAAAQSRSRSIIVQPGLYEVRPAGAGSVSIGAEHVTTGKVYTQLAGRRVKLEGLTDQGWTTLVHTYVNRAGTFALRWTVEDRAVERVRVVMPSGGGLVVVAGPQVQLRTWGTAGQMAASHPRCFGVEQLLDASCAWSEGAGTIAPTVDPARLRVDTGGAYASACWQYDKTALVPVCHAGSDRRDALRVAFIGDSHAAGYFASMRGEFAYWNWSVDSYLGVSCRWEYVPEGHGCEPRYRQLADAAVSGRYDLVVYTGLRFPYSDRDDEAAEIRDRYVRAWQPVVDAGIPLVVLGDFPHIGRNGLDCVTGTSGAGPFGCAVTQAYGTRGHDPALEAAALVPGVHAIDPTRYFCADGSCPLVIGGAIVYRDAHHLTGTYLTSVASKIMWELRRTVR